MKQIILTQGKIALVDDDIYELVKEYNWCAIKNKNNWYAVRSSSRKDCPRGKQHFIYLHHMVVEKPNRGLMVDHIDGDGLNNQRYNLRIVTHRKNQQNTLLHRGGNLPGTTWNKKVKKWISQIQIKGKKIHLGCFNTKQEAYNTYLKAIGNLE